MPRPLFLVFAILVSACGSDAVNPPGDDEPPSDGPQGSGPRFYQDIAPIMNKHCVTCHREGGAGPFPLITYEDAFNVVELISGLVSTRTMPPFNADNSGECNTYRDARWMSDDEIAKVVAWADGDRLVGDPATAPAVPPLPPALARVDATAAMTESYLPAFPRPDDYRCFIVDPGIATDTFLTGFEVRPGAPEVVHHILLFQLDTANAETTVAQLDADSAGPGYECFGGVGVLATSLLAVWAPGVRASTYPAGTGLPVKGGRKMVIQIHYHQHPMEFGDQTAIDLMLDAVPEPAFLYLLAAPDLYVPPQQEAFVVTNQYQLADFFGVFNVWGVFPHMHTLGTSLRAEFDHAGQPQCLTDVPRWDFNWQQGYFYDGPPKIVGGGDMLRISCTYNTMSKGQPTMWGEGTEDEMCLAFVYASKY